MRHDDPTFTSPASLPCSRSPGSLAALLPFQRLDVYRVARSLAAAVCRAGITDAELRDQATRAAKSTFLNLSEGLPSDRPAIRRRYFDHAYGSLHEVAAAVDLAAELGAVDAVAAAEIQAMALRVRSMITGLTGGRGR